MKSAGTLPLPYAQDEYQNIKDFLPQNRLKN
jgi:hypothetical protein